MWLRVVSKKIFGKILGPMPPEKAQKYMDIMRVAYFFSASSLAIALYFTFVKNDALQEGIEEDKQKDLLMGKPVLEDFSQSKSEKHKSMIF